MDNNIDGIIKVLESYGPLTGKQILELLNIDVFYLWKSCNNCKKVITKTVGNRYLRFDKHVEGYARLSPSILREFCSYTVIGLEEQIQEILIKAQLLHDDIKKISKGKLELARDIITKIVEYQEVSKTIKECSCFIISGDVAYEMSHMEPRPEFSTGKLVNGSDLDIVVVTSGLPDSLAKGLDSSIYEQKAYLLKNPSFREEIDYIIKDISKVKEQLKFDSFNSMVAIKILHEGKFLYGNLDIFNEVKKLLIDEGIPEKIAELKEKAIINRNNAISKLLTCENPMLDEESFKLFYTTEEREEFFELC